MRIRKLLPYFYQGIAIGLVIGFVAVVLLSTDAFRKKAVIEIKEAPRREAPAAVSTTVTSYAAAVAAAAPAVVNIHTTKTIKRSRNPFFDDPIFRRFFGIPELREEQQTSLGSGVIVSEQGYVLTNNHVIDGADEIIIALNDGRSVQASVIGTDPETDLAVLHVPLQALPTITFGHAADLRTGDVVLAIGNPFDVGQTVTQGIISATGRSRLGISTFENFIQTDAAINPGNSGGALINTNGELIGVNTAIVSRSGGSQGIGFAIPVDLAKNVMSQIIEHGQPIRGWIGVEMQTLTPELAESFGLKDRTGIIVAGVLRDGPAHQAGLEAGDVITGINDHPIADTRAALNIITAVPPGTKIEITGVRGGKKFTLQLTVGRRPPPNG